ncbi:large subunit ribosomal protein L14e [Nematocida sp. LUAm3]|nr:large subunit ribosomal protein L14e [Nematocida sp. LUAm3]KAI5175499.1 large subunit ribosomal protein L14e [Nematocida sp. LUAm2]KAI5178471.1 large subunit ribosomal protein L14e [Nematocida sp. LUAm1]
MEKRNLLEVGRVVEFKCSKRVAQLGVVVEFITLDSVVIQILSVCTGKAVERKVMTPKNFILTDFVISFDNSEEQRGEIFISSIESSIKEAMEKKKTCPKYQEFLYVAKKREMNDFERFLLEQKEAAQESLLKAKGF